MARSSMAPARLARAAARLMTGPRAMVTIPSVMIGSYLLGGPALLLAAGVAPPLVHGIVSVMRPERPGDRDGVTGLERRAGITCHLDRTLARDPARGLTTACLVAEIDRFDFVAERFGHPAAEEVTRRIAERITAACRTGDHVARLHGNAFAVALAPMRRADLETVIQVATRLQSAISEAIPIEGTSVYVTASIGFCLPARAPDQTGESLLTAAESALVEARRQGPATIRAYSSEMHQRVSARSALISEAEEALGAGHVQPWFQPQVCTDTGRVTGFEALARWAHPERGMIPPSEFLPAMEQAGLMERLSEAMLYRALSALRTWDKMGLDVPSVAVNFAGDELRSPQLVDRIKWELDRFDIEPSRLTVEVLETVVSGTDDDVMTRNLHRLSALGCGIDLDDFGTGNASIGNIRRFAISRIKIDRSFVSSIEDDPEQQRMVSAILTMSERLGLGTLAEGVETAGAHALLSQLGCGHVQGFGIARPMPVDDAARWLERRRSAEARIPQIGGARRAG